ncbi:MAG: diguanylate cyclase [Candidatus Limnocylindrales bacterium]
MELSKDLLLNILFVAIVVNTAIIAVLFAVGRTRRPKRASADVGRADIDRKSGADGPLGALFIDRSARTLWTPASDDVGDLRVADATFDRDREAGWASPPDGTTHGPLDESTRLLDAGGFARLVAYEGARVRRYRRPATVVIVELDGLEPLVARLGPDATERIVPAIAETIRRLARDTDCVAHLGAGRFGVLLPETDEVQAINYVERVRQDCESWMEAGAITLQLAIGWADSNGAPNLAEAQRVATDRMGAELRHDVRLPNGRRPPTGQPRAGDPAAT